MLATLIAGILGFIKKGDLKQASQALENAYIEFLKKDASLFRNIPKEELTDTLLSEHNYTHDHLKILSELFFAEAELQLAQRNNNNSQIYFEKALILVEFTEKNSKSYSIENQSRLSMIQDRLAQLENSPK